MFFEAEESFVDSFLSEAKRSSDKARKLLRGLGASRVVLYTSVVVAYINRGGRLHEQASAIFDAISRGRLKGIVPGPVLVEVFYVAARTYSSLRALDLEGKAERLVSWIYRHPMIGARGAST